MRNILIVLICATCAGCGSASKMGAEFIGYSRECIDGVEYLQFPSGVTPAYKPDGSIKACRS